MDILARANQVFCAEIEAVEKTRALLGESFTRAVELVLCCGGRVVFTGIGKSGIIARKIVATLSSTGTPSFFLHPAEAVHGDLGAVGDGDVVFAVSNSGESEEVLRIVPPLRNLGAGIVAVTGHSGSSLAGLADIVLVTGATREADSFDLAPTASTTSLLVLGDALALCVQELKGFRKSDYASLHPAGELGRRLSMAVDDLMLPAECMPVVATGTDLVKALVIVSRGNLGTVVVVDDRGLLCGIMTDGDLRRFLLRDHSIAGHLVEEVMTAAPKTIPSGSRSALAIREMEKHEITSLVVVDKARRPVGLVHLHAVLGGRKLFNRKNETE